MNVDDKINGEDPRSAPTVSRGRQTSTSKRKSKHRKSRIRIDAQFSRASDQENVREMTYTNCDRDLITLRMVNGKLLLREATFSGSLYSVLANGKGELVIVDHEQGLHREYDGIDDYEFSDDCCYELAERISQLLDEEE